MTQRIIGAAITVHRALGPGFLESIYEEALAVEFALRVSLSFGKDRLHFSIRTIRLANIDSILLVEDLIVVELKAIRALEDIHFAIGRSYLKATGLKDGLFLNFATLSPNDQTLLPRA